MNSIPDSISGWLQPAAKSVLKFKRVSGTVCILRFYVADMANFQPTFSQLSANNTSTTPAIILNDLFSLHGWVLAFVLQDTSDITLME
jgi:hypothetical protein